jgi:hypothetical protein
LHLSTLLRQEIHDRERILGEIDTWERTGKVSAKQAEAMRAELETHHTAEDPERFIDTDALTAFLSWDAFGLPATVFRGITSAVVDERSRLAQPRREMLKERGIHPDTAELYLYLWDVLDREYIAAEEEALQKALTKAQ